MSELRDGDRRKQAAGALIALAGLSAPLFAEQALPNLTTAQAQGGLVISFGMAALGIILIISTFWNSGVGSKVRKPNRRWSTIGFGQGWIEHRVRNNDGAEFGVSANPGAGADEIHLDMNFPTRSRLRAREQVELILEIDSRPFEFFVVDSGTGSFSVRTQVWRDLEAFREIVSLLRRGQRLWVTIPTLDLAAEFTLEGAYDVLSDIEMMESEKA